MPYIIQARRPQLDPTAELDHSIPAGYLPISPAQNAGELNYQIAKLVDRFIKQEGDNYNAINEAIGVLECCKLEVYRRIAAPYEDRKLVTHGDVFT